MAMLFRPLRVFLPLALVCLSYGVIKTIIDLTHDPNISASAILSMMSALLIVLIGMLGDAIATRLGRLNHQAILGVRPNEAIELPSSPEKSVGPIAQETQEPVIYSLARN
jgi:uncharacterized membrane protein YdfJ with MMPL/SSD domain